MFFSKLCSYQDSSSQDVPYHCDSNVDLYSIYNVKPVMAVPVLP